MKNLLGISIILLQLFVKISTTKFGFLLKDEGNVLNEKFVAFGSIPESTEEHHLTEISDRLNRFYRYNRRDKLKKHEIESLKFTVSLFKQAVLPDGNYQVAVKGELTGFLASFALTMKNLIDPSGIWDKVNFYSDPIVIMTRKSYLNAPVEFKVTLLRAAFDHVDFVPNNDLIEYNHKRTMSEVAREKLLEADDLIEFETDEELEFYPSTDSLQDPLVEPYPYTKQKTRKSLNCGCDSWLNGQDPSKLENGDGAMRSPFKAVTILNLVIFNIVGASFSPLPDSKYTELPANASDSERLSDDNESWDGMESLSSYEEDFGNDNYDFINGNDNDSNTVEESFDSRQNNGNLIAPFEPVKFFEDSCSEENSNSNSMVIESVDNTQSEEFNIMPMSDNNTTNEEKVVNDSVQVQITVIKPKKFKCDFTGYCRNCCNIS